VQVEEIVKRINNGEKVGEVAKSLKMAQSTLSRKLKNEGYSYNNKTKVYELISDEKSNEVGKNSEENQKRKTKIEKNVLTEEEIEFVKKAYKRRTFLDRKFEVSWEKSQLPSRKPEKKTSYIISEQTFTEFAKFASALENEYRVTQNELVEIALQRLMGEWK
jgi:hypothetical protein